ncbi:MAG: translocation/assembly module TamB domain-containing protein [Vicinamibacteria bacterium]|nr:translocation/assembly module TamB domain-containing protein [Vicinamibacteria bacterium]
MRRNRRLRVLAFLAAAVLSVALAFVSWMIPEWSARIVVWALSSFFHRPSAVATVRYGLLPFRAEVLDVNVSGAVTGSEPFLHADKVAIIPAWRTLFTRRVTLSQVRVEGFAMRINAFPGGGDDIPRMGSEAPKHKFEVLIRRLNIQQGEFHLNHHRVPVSLDLSDFTTRLVAREASRLAGRFSSRQGWVRFGAGPRLNLSSEIDLVLGASKLTVESAKLQTGGCHLAFKGDLMLTANPQGLFDLRGPVDLKELDRHLWRTGFGIEGKGVYEGSFAIDGPKVRFNGRLSGATGLFDGVPISRYGGNLEWDEHGVRLRDWNVETLGGTAWIDLEIPSKDAPVHLATRYSGVDAEGAIRAIFDLGSFELGADASGDADLTWPKSRTRMISGNVAFDLQPQNDERRTPLSGRFEWSADKGNQRIESARLRTPSTSVLFYGAIDPEDRLDLIIEGGSADLAAADDLGYRLRRALGNGEAMVAGLSGKGSFMGRCRGKLDMPVFFGRFTGNDVGFLGVVWGKAEWSGKIDANHVDSRSLVVRRNDAEIWLDGDTQTGDYGIYDGLDVRARIENWPAEDFIQALKWDFDVKGRVTGNVTVRGRRSAALGVARVGMQSGRCYGVPFADLSLTSRLRGRETEIVDGFARVGGGQVRFHGTATDDEVYDGAATLKDVALDSLPFMFHGWSGAVSGHAVLRGTLARPHVTARMECSRMKLGSCEIGPLKIDIGGNGSGAVRLAGHLFTKDGSLTMDGGVETTPPYDSRLTLRAQNARLDPFVRWLAPSVPHLGVSADGSLVLSGPLGDPARARADLTLPVLVVTLPEYSLRAPRSIQATMADGKIVFRNVQFEGEGTRLTAQGAWPLLGGGEAGGKEAGADLRLLGDVDLRVLGVLTDRIRGRGRALLDVNLNGQREAPHFSGRLVFEGAGLRLRGFPHGVEEVYGTVRLSETSATFSSLRGRFASGELEARGQLVYQGGRMRSFDVQTEGRRLVFRYPEGLRSLVDAKLRFFGDSEHQWISGDVDVRDAAWTRRYDVARELLAIAPPPAEHQPMFGENVEYDVRIGVPGTLHVDNNLVTLDARAMLQLRGKISQPTVMGRAEIERGRVYFGGNTYVIRRGTIDFSNPQTIDPFFDIEAETYVRAYRVTLKLSGTVQRIQTTLSSDPPLYPIQILNLLAGADDSAVNSLLNAQREQPQLGAAGAATLATGWISETVGIEKGVQKLLGLSRFSIDPKTINLALSEKADINATARITVGRRLTPDLSVLYVRDLGGKEERFLTVEYVVTDKVSLLLTQSERSGEPREIGFDVLLRHSK